MAGYRGGGGGGGGVTDLLWSFAGTISVDQNANIPRYVARQGISLTRFWVNVVTPGIGGDVTVIFYVNGAPIATVVLLDGDSEAFVDQAVSLADGDVIYPEVDTMSTITPPETMTFQAV